MKTKTVMDSTNDKEAVNGSCVIKCEDTEENAEEKNGYEMSWEKELSLSNINKAEEDGERQSEGVKREDGAKDEVDDFEREQEDDGVSFSKSVTTVRRLSGEGISDCKKWTDPGTSGLAASSLTELPRVPLIESSHSSFINGYSGESEVFVCSQSPFNHMEETELHQDCEKVHPAEQSRILGYLCAAIKYEEEEELEEGKKKNEFIGLLRGSRNSTTDSLHRLFPHWKIGGFHRDRES
ncbi:hypothetical protein GJAV_G00072020 [Gymnothorax javanicus]|nr:hypothetical protein GJAV_G00072020 [Gymnothorax javanicus]